MEPELSLLRGSSNWESWRCQVERVLVDKGLMDVVTIGMPGDEKEEQFAEVRRNDYKAQSIIGLSVSAGMAVNLFSCTSAQQMWMTLHEVCGQEPRKVWTCRQSQEEQGLELSRSSGGSGSATEFVTGSRVTDGRTIDGRSQVDDRIFNGNLSAEAEGDELEEEPVPGEAIDCNFNDDRSADAEDCRVLARMEFVRTAYSIAASMDLWRKGIGSIEEIGLQGAGRVLVSTATDNNNVVVFSPKYFQKNRPIAEDVTCCDIVGTSRTGSQRKEALDLEGNLGVRSSVPSLVDSQVRNWIRKRSMNGGVPISGMDSMNEALLIERESSGRTRERVGWLEYWEVGHGPKTQERSAGVTRIVLEHCNESRESSEDGSVPSGLLAE